MGPIVARIVSVGHGGKVEDVYADKLELEHGSRAGNLYFREGEIEAVVHIEREVLYTDRIASSPDVSFAKQPSIINELPQPPLCKIAARQTGTNGYLPQDSKS